jgi:hypothetical protein
LTDQLSDWAEQAEAPALVIIDILARITPPISKNVNSYDAVYQVMAQLMDWASERQMALMAVTHATKGKAEDVFEQVMNSTANTGASATNMVMVRASGENHAVLHVEGKDIPTSMQRLALRTVDGLIWECIGDADDVRMSTERREMLEALYDSDGQACTRRQLAEMLDTNTNALNQRIRTAQEAGYVMLRDGKVALTDKAAVVISEARAQQQAPVLS